jgi:hypothetical protein
LNLATGLTSSASNPDDLEQTTSQQCGKWHRKAALALERKDAHGKT